eukprot:NODE_2317_length_721_cov_11.952381_g1875_i0.p2 GENE.NODE_2317_length_721_cov_11.952381_g1875_i0~~NODE_2317_length_721_cov_11.952381_g1875_i0.p2  ORF type:complete len:91 (-),score=9.14 NODE_2317_length_721_cov_11.952381_g1875_i0:149-421(-)
MKSLVPWAMVTLFFSCTVFLHPFFAKKESNTTKKKTRDKMGYGVYAQCMRSDQAALGYFLKKNYVPSTQNNHAFCVAANPNHQLGGDCYS